MTGKHSSEQSTSPVPTKLQPRCCIPGGFSAWARALPLEDDSFDGVMLGAALGETTEPKATLAEIRRVLRPGGLYSNTEQPADPGHIPQPQLRRVAGDAGSQFKRS